MHEPSGSHRMLPRLLPLIILALAALITTALVLTRERPEAQEAPLKRWNVSAVAITPIRATPELTLYGQFEPPQVTRLSSALNADVSRILAVEGEFLPAGSLLIELDQREAELLLRQRKAELSAAEARIAAEQVRHRHDLKSLQLEQSVQALNSDRVKRAESLQARKLLSQEQLDSTRQTYRQQALAIETRRQAIADHPNRLAQLTAERDRIQSLVDSAELDLSRTRIQAPFNTRILSIDTAAGNRVRPGDLLLTLYDSDRLQLRAQLPDSWRTQVALALQAGAVFAIANWAGEPVRLQLDRLAARVNPGQAGVDALFQLPAQAPALLPGQTLQLQLQLPPRDKLFALPPAALYGTDRLYRLAADDRLQAVPVEVAGQRHLPDGERQLLVTSADLQPGDRIITTQLPNAIGGLPVSVVE
ncbi:MAG: efflux RND transporter periplasmic adaptor subunit [Marinobacterium sp.]